MLVRIHYILRITEPINMESINGKNFLISLNLFLLICFFSTTKAQNVGIGTTNPIYKLDVNGQVTARGANAFRLRGADADYGVILRNDASNFWMLLTDKGNPDGGWNTLRPLRIGLGTGNLIFGNGLSILRHTDGAIGINTLNPLAKLDVNGVIRWGTEGAILSTAQGASIELRGNGIPYIDFSNDGASDYDARFVLASNNRMTLLGAELAVLNTLSAKRVKVTSSGYPDYVFKKGYRLIPIEEVKTYIDEKKHLPGVPSEEEIMTNGLDLNDQSIWQQEKIEELFLYTIELNEKVGHLISRVKELEAKLKQ